METSTSTGSSAKDRAAALKTQRETKRPFENTLFRLENKKFSSLIRITQELSKPLTTDELVIQVAQEICVLLKADQVFLLLQDALNELHIRAEYSRVNSPNRNFVSQSVCDRAMVGGAILIPEALSDPVFQSQQSVMALNLRSVMACPVTSVSSIIPIGLLYVVSYTTGELFDQNDLELLRAFAAVVGIHLDRTRALAEKDRALHELEESAVSRGRVVSVANYELGTPTQSIWIGVDVASSQIKRLKTQLEKGEAITSQDLEELEKMLTQAKGGLEALKKRFIEPLRNFNSLELQISQMPPSFMPPSAVETLTAKWRAMAAASKHPLLCFERLPVALQCDQSLIEVALTNLVDNAFKYSPTGSTVNIIASLTKDHLQIVVQDEGIGIPPADLPSVCNWLVRGANVANNASRPCGLGIGLYTARRIIEAHGGQLKIESTLGKGTRVVVLLPAFTERV